MWLGCKLKRPNRHCAATEVLAAAPTSLDIHTRLFHRGTLAQAMATIGRGLYAEAVHEFFEGIRSYDVPRAMAVLADDADMQSPWNEGTLTGKDAIQAVFEELLGDAGDRPSFTIRDISGDGNVVTLLVSVSGRFGKAPKTMTFRLLHLKGIIHHIVVA